MELIFKTKSGVKLYLSNGVYYTEDVCAIESALMEDILNFPFDMMSALMARNLYYDIRNNIHTIQ